MARSSSPPAPPPQPSEGGSYLLENGELRCVARTIQPGELCTDPDTEPTPDPED